MLGALERGNALMETLQALDTFVGWANQMSATTVRLHGLHVRKLVELGITCQLDERLLDALRTPAIDSLTMQSVASLRNGIWRRLRGGDANAAAGQGAAGDDDEAQRAELVQRAAQNQAELGQPLDPASPLRPVVRRWATSNAGALRTLRAILIATPLPPRLTPGPMGVRLPVNQLMSWVEAGADMVEAPEQEKQAVLAALREAALGIECAADLYRLAAQR